ncbi:hypothetical protein RchiOBHm_Chr7g0218761 [Rosa chinensis]|uniref:Uncharacterized protein n=1 Tax=Rosa chinensis TaxID=74649 RepID=A0A2P6PCC4_ROSCH|nr:hypothetical protein RchiOBHm_Chr7g0218761 [Rosa chinensis]
MATDGNAIVPSTTAPVEPNPRAPDAPPIAPIAVFELGLSISIAYLYYNLDFVFKLGHFVFQL